MVDLPAGRQGATTNAMDVFFVYILKSRKDGKYYTGMTRNLRRRVKEHNLKKSNTVSTKNRSNFKLIYYEIHKSRDEARKREVFWKSGYGREIRNSLYGGRSSMVERLPVE